ncbi:hypothetical protein TGP89_253350 [Toxoplasma gondii p89]|uniref:Uncharacterized protein n=1 Tax=Toxoplasma gondii p89 TaxID=943119 RepID=A0A086KRR3_TOXGO|nr:hypothetical protein TGP89_253350 [Toxoplasma gondii p89]
MHRATAKHSTCQPPCQAPAPTTGVSMLPRRRITTTEVNHSPPRPASPSGDGSLETSNRSVAKSSVNMVAAPLSGTSARIPGKEGTTHQPANGSVGSEKEGQETGDDSESKAVNREAAMQLHATVGSTLASGKIRYAAQSPKKAESALETPQPARGKRRDAKQSEKGGNAEEQDEQKQLCDDAVQMLGVIEYYVKDFRDICDTLTKNVVEFVTLRDVYAMKGSGGSVGGAGSSDALSSGSSRRFMSRTRGIGAFTDQNSCIVLGAHARHCVIQAAEAKASPTDTFAGHVATQNRRWLPSPPPAHIFSNLWRSSWTSPLAAVRTLRVAPGSLPLRLFSLALRNGRLAEISEDPDGNSASFFLLSSANLAASLCAETSAVLPGKNGVDHHGDATSWSDVSERERRQREVVSELLRTIPVYAVVSTETQQLVPAMFPSQKQVPRDEVVPPHSDQERATDSKRGKKPSHKKELEKLLYQEFQALTSLEERGGVAKAIGLGLFFLSHRDAQLYLRHVQSQTAEVALPVPTAKRPPSLAVVTTSLAKVYPLLLPPRPTDLPAKLAARSRAYQGTCGGSHVGPGEKSAFSVGRALFGWRNVAGTQGQWVDESEAQELVSRFVLVPDIAQLDTLLEEGGSEAVVVGTPLFFVSRSPEIPWSLLLDGRAPSASGAFPLYLNRRDAEQALSSIQKTLDGQPWWRNLGRRPLTVHRTSLEAFLEAFAEKSAVSAAPSPFLLVPAFDSFLRSEKERRKPDERRKKSGFSVVGPFRQLVASSPTLRYLDWRRRKFIRDWLLPLFRRDRQREGDGHHIGDLLPEDA